MTVSLVARVTCDCCGDTIVVDESPLHARNAWTLARGFGWVAVGGRDLCPLCQLLEAVLRRAA